jgi:tetratricopeptide (TPR) repeat protein
MDACGQRPGACEKRRSDLNAATGMCVFLATAVAQTLFLAIAYLLLRVFLINGSGESVEQHWTKLFPTAVFLSTLIAFAITLAAPLFINRDRLADVSEHGAAWVAGRKSAIFVCFALGVLLESCFWLFNRVFGVGASERQLITGQIMPLASLLSRVMWFLTVVVVAPPSEEMLFRGILYGGINKSFGQIAAIFLTTLLFMCGHSHAFKSLHSLVCFLTFSLVALWCRIRFKAVGPPVALHIACNLTAAAIVLFPLAGHHDGPNVPAQNTLFDAQSPDVYIKKGRAYAREGQPDKAISEFDRAIELDPTNGTAYAFRGIAFLQKGSTERAIADLSQGIVLEPTNALAFDNRGHAYSELGRFEKAISDLTQAIKLDPGMSAAFRRRADAYEKTGDFPKAIADLNKSIELAPDQSASYNDLAWLFATCVDSTVRDGNAAVQLGRKACDLSEWKNANYVDTLAAAFAENGNYNAAVQYEERAINLANPQDTNRFEMQRRLSLYRQNQPYRGIPTNTNGNK